MGGGGPHGGHETWGSIAYFRGLVTHHLSPFEQRTFAGYFTNGIPNIIRRVRGQVFNIGIPFVTGYLVYDWAKKDHERRIRKDPKVFEKEYEEYLASSEYQEYLKQQQESAKQK